MWYLHFTFVRRFFSRFFCTHETAHTPLHYVRTYTHTHSHSLEAITLCVTVANSLTQWHLSLILVNKTSTTSVRHRQCLYAEAIKTDKRQTEKHCQNKTMIDTKRGEGEVQAVCVCVCMCETDTEKQPFPKQKDIRDQSMIIIFRWQHPASTKRTKCPDRKRTNRKKRQRGTNSWWDSNWLERREEKRRCV